MAPKLVLKMKPGRRGATRVSESTNTNGNSISAPPNNDQIIRAQRTRSGVRASVRGAAGDTETRRRPEVEENVTENNSHPASTFVTLRVPPRRLRQILQSTPSCGPFITLKIPKSSRRSLEQKPSSPSDISQSSPPSLLFSAGSTFSETDYGQSTPATTELSPQRYPTKQPAGAGLKERGVLPLPAPTPYPIGPTLYEVDARNEKMAPVKDTSHVHDTIKDIIQDLTEIQIQTHGYVPETQDLLVEKMTNLAESLSRLQNLTSATASPNNYIHQVQIAPEIVDYVDDGRNPDIFTRDFVENVQRGNAVINGKQQAFKDFSEIYAKALKEGIPGVSREVDRVLENAGFEIPPKKEEDQYHDESNANGSHMPDGA